MNFVLTSELLVTAVVALLIGLILGFALRGGAKRRALRAEDQVGLLIAERDGLRIERDAAIRERDVLDERLRPMAADLDRYKRAETRRVVPVSEVSRTDGVVPGSSGADVVVPAAAAGAGVRTAADEDVSAGDLNDLRRLKGVGDRFAVALAQLGVGGIDAMAALSGAEADRIDAQLGSFQGRIRTDRLVEQARLLHEGRTTEYEARFGAL